MKRGRRRISVDIMNQQRRDIVAQPGMIRVRIHTQIKTAARQQLWITPVSVL